MNAIKSWIWQNKGPLSGALTSVPVIMGHFSFGHTVTGLGQAIGDLGMLIGGGTVASQIGAGMRKKPENAD